MRGRSDPRHRPEWVMRLVCVTAAGLFAAATAAAAEPPKDHFELKVRPVLVEHCYPCHSAQAKSPKGGLRLDGRELLVRGGDSGPAAVPGEPAMSRLIEAVRYQNPELQMPPKGKLPAAVIADLEAWVAAGCPWPGDRPAGPAA